MLFTVVAVTAGLAIGLLSGGRLRHLGERDFRAWWLLATGLAVQAVSNRLDEGGFALLLVSYALLLLFAAVNLSLSGMWLVVLGLGLNAFTIAANGGMPVRPEAVVAAGIAQPGDDLSQLRIGGKRHLERPDDRLMLISDIIPVRPLREVLSFGDLFMSFGTANVLFRLLRPPPPRSLASHDRSHDVTHP